MEGVNSIDFDSVIDNFFDYFTEDLGTGEFEAGLPIIPQAERKRGKQRSHKIKKEIKNEQVIEGLSKKNDLLMAPKVVKNDIRRYYSQMFMNTINCGDFNQLQGYFSTFMRGPAKFLANYGNFNPSLRLPSRLVADGPKLMSHFLLGVFVMYPDMVMQMKDTRVITSNAWTGTKIEMSVEFLATKMYDLSIDEWVPELETLEEKCSSLTKVKRDEFRNYLTSPALGGPTDLSKNVLNRSEECLVSSSSMSTSPSSLSSVDSAVNVGSSILSDNSYQDSPHKTNPSQRERKHVGGDEINVDFPATKRTRTPDVPRAVASSSNSTRKHRLSPPYAPSSTLIPEAYVRALCAQAALLPTPLALRMAGMVTLFLDENNHIQHMSMEVFPKEG